MRRRRRSREHKFTLNLLLLHPSVNFTLLCVFVQTPGGAAIDRPPYYTRGGGAGGGSSPVLDLQEWKELQLQALVSCRFFTKEATGGSVAQIDCCRTSDLRTNGLLEGGERRGSGGPFVTSQRSEFQHGFYSRRDDNKHCHDNQLFTMWNLRTCEPIEKSLLGSRHHYLETIQRVLSDSHKTGKLLNQATICQQNWREENEKFFDRNVLYIYPPEFS